MHPKFEKCNNGQLIIMLLSLPAAILEHIADILFATSCAHKLYHEHRPEGRYQQGLRSTAVLQTCSELLSYFKHAHWKALMAACASYHPAIDGMANSLSLSRAELTRLLTLIKYFDDDGRKLRGPSGRDEPIGSCILYMASRSSARPVAVKVVGTIPWHFNPIGTPPHTHTLMSHHLSSMPLVPPFDPSIVHILVRVRVSDVLLFSAHGTWSPRAPRLETVIGGPLRDDNDAVIDLSMTPSAPMFTTPKTLFGLPENHESVGEGIAAAFNDVWQRRSDVALAEQLGTAFSEYHWGETQREECTEKDAFQVDVRLVHVLPRNPECGPREFRWAALCTNKAHFRTEVECHEVPSDGLSIVGDKVCWRLSAALPFDHDGNELVGASADGILYAPECYAEDSWFEVNVDLESTLQPWSSAQGQEHTVRAASLGIVWQMSVEGSPSREKAMDLVPSRVAFEADTNGWQV
jgi:hypothetical protein